jgi:hypothetical protein
MAGTSPAMTMRATINLFSPLSWEATAVQGEKAAYFD